MDKIIFEHLDELKRILQTRLKLPKMVVVWCGLTTLFFYPQDDLHFTCPDDIINEVTYIACNHGNYVGCVFFDQDKRFNTKNFPEVINEEVKHVN